MSNSIEFICTTNDMTGKVLDVTHVKTFEAHCPRIVEAFYHFMLGSTFSKKSVIEAMLEIAENHCDKDQDGGSDEE